MREKERKCENASYLFNAANLERTVKETTDPQGDKLNICRLLVTVTVNTAQHQVLCFIVVSEIK
jgi:hypothetical protein